MNKPVYLTYQQCARRWPRVTAALMRPLYLTETEAAIVIREWLRPSPGRPSSVYWTSMEARELQGVIAAMRTPARRPYLRENLQAVLTYFRDR